MLLQKRFIQKTNFSLQTRKTETGVLQNKRHEQVKTGTEGRGSMFRVKALQKGMVSNWQWLRA